MPTITFPDGTTEILPWDGPVAYAVAVQLVDGGPWKTTGGGFTHGALPAANLDAARLTDLRCYHDVQVLTVTDDSHPLVSFRLSRRFRTLAATTATAAAFLAAVAAATEIDSYALGTVVGSLFGVAALALAVSVALRPINLRK